MQKIKSLNLLPLLWFLDVILIIAIFIADINYPTIAIHSLYIVVILLTLWLPKTKHIIFFASLNVSLIIIGYYLVQNNIIHWENIINRIITVFVVMLIAMFVIYRKITPSSLIANEQKQYTILDTAIEPIIILDKNQIIQTASKSIEYMFGWQLNEIIGQKFYVLLAEPFATQYRNYFAILNSLNLKNSLNTKAELLIKHKNTTLTYCEISITKINTSFKKEHFFSINLKNLEERKQFVEQLIWLSVHDGLTGIFNRRYFDNQIQIEWSRLMRTKNFLALIMLDIDDFKKYNDVLGHQQGDRCLQMIANVIHTVINRAGDFVARYGGEEFVLLMPYTTDKGSLHIARKIQERIKELKIVNPFAETGKFVTVSMGLTAMVPIHSCTIDVLIKRADHALYQAKNSGKNCYKLYTEI